MTYTIDIFNKNLEKLEVAKKTFPTILGEISKKFDTYKSSLNINTLNEISELRKKANNLRLSEYVNFIEWLSNNNAYLTNNEEVTFNKVKESMILYSKDDSVKKIIEKKTKKGLITLINSTQYLYLTGRRRMNRYSKIHNRRILSTNFLECEPMIIKFLIQNNVEIDTDIDMIFYFYKYELSNFETSATSELEITNEIIKSIERKLKTIKYDFKKLNLAILENEIKSSITKKMLALDTDEKVKCLEPVDGRLTQGKLYDVIEYKIGSLGTLNVRVKDDKNGYGYYNYCIFEGVTKFRTDRIDDILSNLDL